MCTIETNHVSPCSQRPQRLIAADKMGLHLPSALVGSVFAGCGFLLIHRELSYRHRLTTKWKLQEYAEEQWKEWRKGTIDPFSDSAQVSMSHRVRIMEKET